MTSPFPIQKSQANINSHYPQCGYKNWNMDGNLRWAYQTPEKCRTRDCNHIRCRDCYDCDEDEARLQRCDGARILGLSDDANALWTPPPGNTKPTFPCPLKAAKGCDRLFLTSEAAARHVRIHNPVLSIFCGIQGCDRQFTRIEDRDKHRTTHTGN